jgi:anthranilate synthase/aminodeoxychorismate synthase-like glutamine amidotransferase
MSLEVIRRFGPTRPLLGVCLGHQAIGQAFGGRVVRAAAPVHGKTSVVVHDGKGIFQGIDAPFDAGRYHSLIVDADAGAWPAALEVAATVAGAPTVMALRHREFPIHGVQFHPESVLTPAGRAMLATFLEM